MNLPWIKRPRIKKILLAAAGFFLSGALFALDFSAAAGGGNLSFGKNSTTSIGEGEFSGQPYPLGQIGVSGALSDLVSFSAFFRRDPILGNILDGNLCIDTGYLSFSVGPLFGIANTPETPFSPGIAAGIRADIPGIIFMEVTGGGNFSALREEGSYTIESTRAVLGFWSFNLINTLGVSFKKFSARRGGDLFTEDKLLRFCYRAEVYEKNVPYTVSIDAGYQTLSRSYDRPGLKEEDSIRSVFLGFETTITVRPLLKIIFGAEIPLYVWGKEPLTRSDSGWFVQGFGGFIWSFE
ncbi:MAG: hypothetical protein LBO65_08475 [Spirochaetaceae bacterium]|jgi:hypothetical protein|nr:hypothetical protein [Spirochaetaceae bacterium]